MFEIKYIKRFASLFHMMFQRLTQQRVQVQLLVNAQVVLDQRENLIGIKRRGLDESCIIHKHEQTHNELTVHAIRNASVTWQHAVKVLNSHESVYGGNLSSALQLIPTLILCARLIALAKNPPNGAINEAKSANTTPCNWNGTALMDSH